MTAFGTTQFSVLYLVGGIPFLVFGCFVLGRAFRWLSTCIKDRILASEITFYAYLPFLCVLWVKVLCAGGMISLYLKELLLIVGCFYCVERICYRTQQVTVEDDHGIINALPSMK